ncbi:4Fe-4S binding protein [Natranaerofaba carboxydovora]|uniref:4Fe-4S binding protein n=1 Tax=Natranaerofaba carboxydovora TaxID=2742683 RepID=UPI001F13A8AC|nr:4Fe-4S binding protein [Natranaerofaba carboxydovora]UMZ73162.1 4Fe-4S binding domain protein [Natranaerofaba carboxydovora]
MFFRGYLVKKLTEGNVPSLITKFCVNRKMRRERCRECSRICGENALSFSKNELPILDKDRCNGCHLCVDVCPSRAFMSGTMKYIRLYQKALTKSPLVIGCIDNGDNVNLKFPCVYSISSEFLISLLLGYRGKEISFYLGDCEDCSNNKSYELYQKRLQKAKDFVSEIKELPEIKEIHEYEENPLEEEPISRRDLFKMFSNETTKSTKDIADELLNRNKPSPLPDDRKLLIEILKHNEVRFNENMPLPFKFWELNENCNGCAMCSNVCPHKAWDKKIDKENDKIEIRHFPWLCFGCGICERYCPRNAIKESTYDGKTFSENIYFVKKLLTKSRCPRCKRKFVQTEEMGEMCPTCEKKEKNKKV